MKPGSLRHGVKAVLLAAALPLAASACAGRLPSAAALEGPPPPAPSTFHVLMLSGGGSPAINYQTHLLHLDELRRIVAGTGIPADHVTILASDGADPAPDLATREAATEPDLWRLTGTALERKLAPQVALVSSELPGAKLEPATKASVLAWFEGAKARLRPGDTLLLYVTDHGTRGGAAPMKNRITLWGKDASLDGDELAALLRQLAPGVRVALVMSQCYSGGFAGLARSRSLDGEPDGSVCGYFSSTFDRPAYGCFAENKGKANVGHAFHFLHALAATGRLRYAHAETVVTDVTPDVPLATSDTYLESVLADAAKARAIAPTALADELLRELWRDQAPWALELDSLNRLAKTFGLPAPRSLSEVDALASKLGDVGERFSKLSGAWRDALYDMNGVVLERFLAARPAWRERTADAALARLDAAATRALTAELLRDLGAFAATDGWAAGRLARVYDAAGIGGDAAYRMQVRTGIVLRMRTLLTSMAARLLLDRAASPRKASYERLRACESLALPGEPRGVTPAPELPTYPALEADLALAQSVTPGWLGIQFQTPKEDRRAARGLLGGAAVVAVVYPDSPASAAGLLPGDVVVGPPGSPFLGRNEIRLWTMLSKTGEATPLEIVRSDKRVIVRVAPAAYPQQWPSLPGPPKVGATAPPVEVTPYRGPVRDVVTGGGKHLLMFFATWCGPCKASLPEVMAYSKAMGVPVVAITDEDRGALDTFFKGFRGDFPALVATDEDRRAFAAFAVGGVPTYALIEGGVMRGYQVGYTAERGLELPGYVRGAAPLAKPPEPPKGAGPSPRLPGPKPR